MITVSVVIPVYNVGAYIGKCVKSLMEQTLRDVEFIFVDDASKDDSIAIARSIVSQYPDNNVVFLTHQENKGLPAARNTGLESAHGEYVFHCDSDDWLESDMLERLYVLAKQKDADLVYCDYYLSFDKSERRISNEPYSDPEDFLKKGMLGGKIKYNVWNKLVRRSIYTDYDISFPSGHSMGEDMTMIRIAARIKSVVYCPNALYHYNKINMGAFSQNVNEKRQKDILYNTDLTINYLDTVIDDGLEPYLSYFKLGVKLPFLITDDKRQHELWKQWYPESDKEAFSNKDIPFRTRLLQLMASKGQYWYVTLYYKVVIKFVYGILYK